MPRFETCGMTKVTNSSANPLNHKAAPESRKSRMVTVHLPPQLLVAVEGSGKVMAHPQPVVASLGPGEDERRLKPHPQIPKTFTLSAYDPDTFLLTALLLFYLCFAIYV